MRQLPGELGKPTERCGLCKTCQLAGSPGDRVQLPQPERSSGWRVHVVVPGCWWWGWRGVSIITYIVDNWGTLAPQVVTHIEIVAMSMAAAALIGLILGVFAARSERFSTLILGVTSTLLTVPSFALFGLLSIWAGLGNPPVIIGLVLYALLPVVRNTATGIRAVEPAVTEAARGMGMRPSQVLARVELPLAAPAILGGLRQATVMVVAIATVGATVGADDLGQPILEALGRSSGTLVQILAGVIPVAAIGLVADGVLAGIQRALSRGAARGAVG